MAADPNFQHYTAGQNVTARVIDLNDQEVLVLVDDAVPGILPVARPVNFEVDPPRHVLPGDTLTLTVKRLDERQRRLILAFDRRYTARLNKADSDQIADETRRAIMVMSQQRALALEDDPPDDDLFFDFDSRSVVHGSHSQPYMLDDDFDNPAEMLYLQIDEKSEDDESTDADEDVHEVDE